VIGFDHDKLIARLDEFMNCPCGTRTNVSTKARFGPKEWVRRYLEQVLVTQEERNNYILKDLVRHHIQVSEPELEWSEKALVNGMRLCWGKCMPFLYGVSASTLRGFKSLVENGVTVWVHQGKGQGKKAYSLDSRPTSTFLNSRFQNLLDG